MRLKCIKLAGFKSFVDPTTVNFPSNLCAIVGPNGCGKSNVIDAVRWVMGESSAKNLRGESMTDVIFNGSNTRKPTAQASIELVFDNADSTLGGEYAAFSEISIKRKVTRDGQSEYQLNGQKCRRRDITDIFLGTGLGPRSYAIIEQGMISKLIEAKPEELRIFIEEAAGISKYKERRKETESRMRRTQENLERLTDIRDELDRQLQHLKRQAASAEKYTEYKAEERLYKAQLQALQWRELDDQLSVRKESITELELKVEECVTRQTSLDTDVEKLMNQHTESNDAFNKIQGRFYSLGAEIARAEQTISHQHERARQLADDFEQTTSSCREAEEHLAGDKTKLEGWQEELLAIEPELEMIQQTEEESAETLTGAEEAMHGWQTRWDTFNNKAADARQRAEVQQSRIQHSEKVHSRIRERIDRLEAEKNNLVSSDIEQEIAELVERIAELDLEIEAQNTTLEDLREKIDNSRERVQTVTRELDEAKGSLQTKLGRQSSLEALQQAAQAQKGGAVSGWIERHGLKGAQRLAAQLKVESGWETAVETVLGDQLQSLCVDDLAQAPQWLADFTKGAVNLFEVKTFVAAGAGVLPTLASKVVSPASVAGLVGGIYVADDLPAALVARKSLAAHESVITRDGLWLGANWLRVAKEVDANSGVLARAQELETLAVEIDDLDAHVTELGAQLNAARNDVRAHELSREGLQRTSNDTSRKHAELRSQHSARQARIEQMMVRRDNTQREIDEARTQFQQEQENMGEARVILSEAIEAMEQDADMRESLLKERDDNRTKLDAARQRARHDKDHAHQLAMRHQNLKTQIDSIAQALSRTRAQVEQLQARRSQLELQMAENSNPLDGLKGELESMLEKRLKVEQELTEARRALEAVDHELRGCEKRRSQIMQETQMFRGQLEHARLDSQTLQVRRKTLQEQLAEAEFELEAVLAEMPANANQQEWTQTLEQIAGRVARLGPINLAAIDEYKVQSERKDYLDRQNDDLAEALNTLESAIRKIDRETRSRFKDTFDQINAGVQDLFPKVFGGGRAYLEMTGEDLLDTGITIMAQPPGKRNSTIHLLSGGEKALTAIALVFSIFKLNPAPFCMLDEVDAPLDDANVGRYARMVKEMSSQVQFIYITHNKIAMEMADQLLGVTMHEPGVSRLVTVDVQEAAELAAS